jgi:hypothetical protein
MNYLHKIVDITPEDWIRIVLRKIQEYSRRGADFKETRWLFDWDDSLDTAINSANIHAEQSALNTLANNKVIDLRIENVNTDLKRFNRIEDYKLNAHTYEKPDSDIVSNHSGLAYWVTNFDQEIFDKLCKKYHVSQKLHAVSAQLFFEEFTTPVVRANSTTYRFKSMRDGSPAFQIVKYAYEQPGQIIKLSVLKEHIKLHGVRNINVALKATQFNSNDGSLKPFIKTKSDTIKIIPKIRLTPGQLKLIAHHSSYYDE